MNRNINIINDDNYLSVETLVALPRARLMRLNEVVPLLVSPLYHKSLETNCNQSELIGEDCSYPIIKGMPILYPDAILQDFLDNGLPFNYYSDPIKQYFLLSQIKQHGEINASSNSIHYQRHLYRIRNFVNACTGTVLDIGCDVVEISAALFSDRCSYVGLDPFATDSNHFRIVGVAECLPFRDQSFDNVVFNTSLDHVLDYHTAIEEAVRVLQPNGNLIIASLCWNKAATLLTDTVHFHHFREYEIFGAINDLGLDIVDVKKYHYKNDDHRYSCFVHAKKHYRG